MGELMSKVFIDPSTLPAGFGGFLQVCFLALSYGYILFTASNLIADGSELLLLLPAFGKIVGPIVLPILGAVPDGAIVLFSGLGPNAQQQLEVGVGALAGSTIMLLTVPWCLSIVGGRVDMINGVPQYTKPRGIHKNDWRKLTPGNRSLRDSGVAGSPYVATNGLILLFTSLAYLIIQLPAFYAEYENDTPDQARSLEGKFAGVGAVLCFCLFLWYLVHQYRQAQRGDDKQLDFINVQVRIKAITQMNLSLKAVISELRGIDDLQQLGDTIRLNATMGSVRPTDTMDALKTISARAQPFLSSKVLPTKLVSSLREILRPFFHSYDLDGNGRLDFVEIQHVFKSLNEYPTDKQKQEIFRSFDVDKSAYIDFDEFVEMILCYLFTPEVVPNKDPLGRFSSESSDFSDDDDEEVPNDLAHLPPHVQRRYIARRAFIMMALGTVLVLVFSDPVVGVFSDLGNRTGISSFYISFILAPLASNASELFASYNYALKKTQKSIEISFSSLQGAGCMNNTFCLGVFLAIVYFRGLIWQYSAETISIILVEICISAMSQKRSMSLVDALMALSLFPLSLALVKGLKSLQG